MSREAMKLALEALEPLVRRAAPWGELDWLNGCKAITALREALAEQPAPVQQEPVAYGMWDTMLGKGSRMMMVRLDKGQDGCTVPLQPQRTWVGLTDERIESVRHMRDVQGYDGNWNYDPYMQGLYNGLEFALSLLEVREPQFKDAPETWLGDIKVKYKLSSETEAKLRSKNEDRN